MPAPTPIVSSKLSAENNHVRRHRDSAQSRGTCQDSAPSSRHDSEMGAGRKDSAQVARPRTIVFMPSEIRAWTYRVFPLKFCSCAFRNTSCAPMQSGEVQFFRHVTHTANRRLKSVFVRKQISAANYYLFSSTDAVDSLLCHERSIEMSYSSFSPTE